VVHRTLIILACCCALGAAELDSDSHAALVAAHEALQTDDSAAALAALEPYASLEVAAMQAMRGHALRAAGRDQDAIAAFQAALTLEPGDQQYVYALLTLYAAHDNWAELVRIGAAHLDWARCDQAALVMVAQAAERLGDAPYASALAERGQLRFPDSIELRQLLVHLALQRDDRASARAQLDHLQNTAANNSELWRLRVHAADDDDSYRQALELALLSDPKARDLHRAYAAACSAADQHAEALRQAEALLTEANAADRLLALRIATAANDTARCTAWLAATPEAERGPFHRQLQARLALSSGDTAAARAALQALITAGEADNAILIQAGLIEQNDGDTATAEALYRQAHDNDSALAGLYLARLLANTQRRDEARQLLESLSRAHPELDAARHMLSALGSR
jgi:tetratricopeptide (TPR) repeat protein